MNKTETGEIRRSNMRARMYHPAAMLVHGIAPMPAKNAGALMAISGIKDAVHLIHGPAGCASLRQMNSFASSSPASQPRAPISPRSISFSAVMPGCISIIDLHNRLRPALIVTIPTCSNDMISDDLNVIMNAVGAGSV